MKYQPLDSTRNKPSMEQMAQLDKLTRQQLKELEERQKTPFQKFLDLVIMLLPVVCGLIAIAEYHFVPNNSPNNNPMTYMGFLIILVSLYVLYFLYAFITSFRSVRTAGRRIQ